MPRKPFKKLIVRFTRRELEHTHQCVDQELRALYRQSTSYTPDQLRLDRILTKTKEALKRKARRP